MIDVVTTPTKSANEFIFSCALEKKNFHELYNPFESSLFFHCTHLGGKRLIFSLCSNVSCLMSTGTLRRPHKALLLTNDLFMDKMKSIEMKSIV